ncbi:M15 family metallopeptidase [Spongiimicrobium sp. 3-5]|uniref:M15 family metallopeptidase n=1 Tax=Spongiimicrobium sp. 3-5 TaxID=3332596 RepID=UPI00397FA425
MINKNIVILIFSVVLAVACKNNKAAKEPMDAVVEKPDTSDIKITEPATVVVKMKTLEGLADTTFVRLADYSKDFVYDLRYATKNNFLEAKVYNCAECYTRVKTAKALLKANAQFMKQGYKIKFFDCYRPNSVQYKMWAIVPNPQYVADPVKGSIHNKGGAVDITLVTLDGEELDMGTDFDFFGKKAYHDNLDLPKTVLDNRTLLKGIMESHGFWSIRTEWWHYNLSAASNDPIADFKWECTTTEP